MKNKNFLNTLLASSNKENKTYIIKNGGNIANYLISLLDAEYGYHWYLTDDEIQEFETSSDRRQELEDEVISFIKDNYNYDIVIIDDEVL